MTSSNGPGAALLERRVAPIAVFGIILAGTPPEAYRPLSDSVPPALLPLHGRPVLARVVEAMRRAGACPVVVANRHAARLEAWARGAVEVLPWDRLPDVPGASDARVVVTTCDALWVEDALVRSVPVPTLAAQPVAAIFVLAGSPPRLVGLVTQRAVLERLVETVGAGTAGDGAGWLAALQDAASAAGMVCATWPYPHWLLPLDSLGAWYRAALTTAPERGAGLEVDPTAWLPDVCRLDPPVVVGAWSRLEMRAHVSSSILLGENRLGAGCRLDACVLGPGQSLAAGARLSGAVVHDGEIGALPGGSRSAPLEEHAAALLGMRGPVRATTLRSGFKSRVLRLEGPVDDPDGGPPWIGAIVKGNVDGAVDPLRLEHRALRLLRGAGVAPRPGFLDARCRPVPHPLLICEAVAGEELSLEGMRSHHMEAIGRLLRRVHAVGEAEMPYDFPSWGYTDLAGWLAEVRGWLRYYESYRRAAGLDEDGLLAAMRDALRHVEAFAAAAPTWTTPPRGLCHGDCVPHNFLYDARGELRLIDWELAGRGDPAYELAWMLMIGRYGRDNEDALLGGYGPLEDGFRERMDAYRAVGAAAWPIQIAAYLARYRRESFGVASTPEEYVAYQTRETLRRLGDGFAYLSDELGWSAPSGPVEGLGTVVGPV